MRKNAVGDILFVLHFLLESNIASSSNLSKYKCVLTIQKCVMKLSLKINELTLEGPLSLEYASCGTSQKLFKAICILDK